MVSKPSPLRGICTIYPPTILKMRNANSDNATADGSELNKREGCDAHDINAASTLMASGSINLFCKLIFNHHQPHQFLQQRLLDTRSLCVLSFILQLWNINSAEEFTALMHNV